MKKLIAFYKKSRNSGIRGMIAEYNTKKNFKQDIRGNGYRLIAVLNEKQVKKIYGSKLVTSTEFKGLAKNTNYSNKQDILDYINNVDSIKENFNI